MSFNVFQTRQNFKFINFNHALQSLFNSRNHQNNFATANHSATVNHSTTMNHSASISPFNVFQIHQDSAFFNQHAHYFGKISNFLLGKPKLQNFYTRINKFESIIFKYSLQFISNNRRALTDFNNFFLFFSKKICLIPFNVTQKIALRNDSESVFTTVITKPFDSKSRDSLSTKILLPKKKKKSKSSKNKHNR